MLLTNICNQGFIDMNKREAVRQIRECADWMLIYRIKDADIMREELEEMIDIVSSEDWIESSILEEYSNGFYIGDMENSERHGLGVYLWYKNPAPNSVYIGEWINGKRTGEGLSLSAGLCYYGTFLDGKFHGENAYCVGNDDLVFLADFHNDDITRVIRCTNSFTYNGKKYNCGSQESSTGSSGGNDSCSGCLGFIIIAAIVFGLLKYCNNCSCSNDTDKPNTTEIYKPITKTYVCTSRSTLNVRQSPNSSARIIGKLRSGEEVEVYDVIGDFAKIRYNGSEGYASLKYLRQK